MIEYYNSNEMRAYPLYENAIRVAADGTALPNDMIADLVVTVPRTVAASLYLGAMTVTPGIVSISIGSSAGGIFAGTYGQPVVPYRAYALSPVVGMASGYVVFGQGILRSTEFRFVSGSLVVSGLDEGTVHPIEPEAVLSVGRYLALDKLALKGIVKLEAGDNITIRYHEGKIKVGLVEASRYLFVGPCDRQALFDNCGGPPIRTINGVRPDEHGAITLEIDNA